MGMRSMRSGCPFLRNSKRPESSSKGPKDQTRCCIILNSRKLSVHTIFTQSGYADHGAEVPGPARIAGMKLIKPLFTLLFPLALYAQTPAVIDLRGAQTVMEYTGQVTNAGTGSIQVGYLNYVKGFNAVFSAGTAQDESTALFTFFTSAITTRNVLNGTIRSVTREGTTTVYLAKGPGDFANPDSFRSGTPIQTSSMRQQVLIDTVTSGFTVSNYNVINVANLFTVNGSAYQFGAPGQTFRTELTGHLTATAPPSGYFGGYAVGSSDTAPFLGATPNPAPPTDSTGLVQVTLTWGAPGAIAGGNPRWRAGRSLDGHRRPNRQRDYGSMGLKRHPILLTGWVRRQATHGGEHARAAYRDREAVRAMRYTERSFHHHLFVRATGGCPCDDTRRRSAPCRRGW